MTKILVPIDDSATTRQTVKTIIDQKSLLPRYITLLHVIKENLMMYRMVPDFQFFAARENAKKMGNDILDRTSRKLRIAGFTTDVVLTYGKPRDTIIETANHMGFELLIIGRNQTRGQLRNVLLGSTTNHILHKVNCPILLC